MSADTRRLAGVIEAPSVEELSAATGLDAAEIEDALNGLERRGLIERRGDRLGFYWPSSI